MDYDDERDITIHGLTEEQRIMLDKIWGLKEYDEFDQFVRGLPRFRQQQVATLCLMVNHEYMEYDLEEMTEYPDADALFNKIKQKRNN